MKPTTPPIICGMILTAICSAALTHWWSVENITLAYQSGMIAPMGTPPFRKPSTAPASQSTLAAQNQQPAVAASQPDNSQKQFFEALIQKMSIIENQNRDLVDQLAETNRDMMKLEFRVDTHSESFRPLPTSEESSATTYDDSPGVLPPRAEPVSLPSEE